MLLLNFQTNDNKYQRTYKIKDRLKADCLVDVSN